MSVNVEASVIHLQAGCLSVVLDCSLKEIPRIAYWGQALRHESAQTLRDLALASQMVAEGNSPDYLKPVGMIPLESDGWMGRPGLSGSRTKGLGWAPRLALVGLSWTGAPATFPGESVGVLSGPGTLEVSLVDKTNKLSLLLVIEMIDVGIVRCCARITNDAHSSYLLDELGLVFPLPLEANQILDTTGRWGKERHPQRRPVTLGTDLRESRHGRTGFDAPGVTFVGAEGFSFASGEVWGLHTAYSGNHRTWVEKLPTGQQVFGGSELLLPGEVELGYQESYTTPWIYGLHSYGLDCAANLVHSWLRSRPGHPKTPRPVTLNVWEAVYFRHDQEELCQLADVAAKIGVERYVLDDGWFLNRRNDQAGLGDWYVDSEVWPGGLQPLVDHVHDLGMQFGLWFEPEMVSPDSNLAREHPEWIMGAQGSTDADQLPPLWRHQQVLNISLPEVRDYIENRVVSLVQTLGIDYLKWDHNRDLIEAGDLTAQGRAAVHAQTKALYQLLDSIRQRCPGLEIESCASGGGRIDWEIIERTDRVWVSDCIDPVERQEMVGQLVQLLPLELMGTHVASPVSHTTGRTSTLSARGATALWGHFGIEWNIATLDQPQLDELAAWIAFYRENRALLHSGKVVRCETPDPSLWLFGVVSEDCQRGLFALICRDRAPLAPIGRLRFRGLNQGWEYRIRPRVVGEPPGGLTQPPWFGGDATEPGGEVPGTVLGGEALELSGVATPRLNPEQVLLIEIEHHQFGRS